MKNSFRIMVMTAMTALLLGSCNTDAPTAEETAAPSVVDNTTTVQSSAPATTSKPQERIVRDLSDPAFDPTRDSTQSNVGSNAFNQIMENEYGFYYNSAYFDKLSLHFYDKETGKTIYLCGKPECLHDGNEFCTATSNRYLSMSTALYGDKLYISVIDDPGNDREDFKWKLLAAGFDGSSLSEVCEIVKSEINYTPVNRIGGLYQCMVLHRGKALVPYSLHDPSTVNDHYSYILGYTVIDLATGKIEYTEEFVNMEAGNYKAAGNAFYYLAENEEKSTDKKGVYDIYRYDITAKKSERLDIYESLGAYLGHEPETYGCPSFVVADNKIWFISGDYTLKDNGIYVYDLATGETRSFTELEEISPDQMNSAGRTISVPFTIYGSEDLTYDGKYLYLSNLRFTQAYDPHDPNIRVIGTDGKYYGEIKYDFGSYHGHYSVSFLNGNVYLQTTERVISAPVDDILQGQDSWQEIFTFQDVEYR